MPKALRRQNFSGHHKRLFTLTAYPSLGPGGPASTYVAPAARPQVTSYPAALYEEKFNPATGQFESKQAWYPSIPVPTFNEFQFFSSTSFRGDKPQAMKASRRLLITKTELIETDEKKQKKLTCRAGTGQTKTG